MIQLKEHNQIPYRNLCQMLDRHKHCAYVSATGTGKSYVAARYIEAHGLLDASLVIVPSDFIRTQWESLLPGLKTVTYQSLLVSLPELQGIRMIICDELHHLGAKEWGKAFMKLTEGYDGMLLGLTATPVRYLDECRNMVDEMFGGNLVYGADLPDAISNNILPSFDYVTALYNFPDNIPGRDRADAYTETLFRQLDVMRSEYSFRKILKKYLEPTGHKVAVFVNQISEIPVIMEVCRGVYPHAGHYTAHSQMSDKEAADAMAAFLTDPGQSFLYTVNILNEGAHISGVDCIIMFRKTESPVIYLQQLGRALTSDMAGGRVLIFDFVANHSNLQTYISCSGTVTDWIARGITSDTRQIVVNDYALEELELINRIGSYFSSFFTPEEDALLREHYGQPGAVAMLAQLMPNRTEDQIRARASYLGLARKRASVQSAELREDVRKYYNVSGGRQLILDKHPEASAEIIRYTARRLGLTGKRKTDAIPWTPEEDQVLLESADKQISELAKLLPARTQMAISYRKRVLGISGKRGVWPENADSIIRENTGMKPELLREQFFPNMSLKSVTQKRLQILAQLGDTSCWEDGKKELFSELYTKGGLKSVLNSDAFSWMEPGSVRNAAVNLGLKKEREACKPWTSEEENIILECLKNGDGHNNQKLISLIPGHSPNAVIQKKYSLLKKTS